MLHAGVKSCLNGAGSLRGVLQPLISFKMEHPFTQACVSKNVVHSNLENIFMQEQIDIWINLNISCYLYISPLPTQRRRDINTAVALFMLKLQRGISYVRHWEKFRNSKYTKIHFWHPKKMMYADTAEKLCYVKFNMSSYASDLDFYRTLPLNIIVISLEFYYFNI